MAYAGAHTGAQVDEGIRKGLQMPELKGEKANFAALPGGASVGDIWLVIAETGFWPFKKKAGWYRWSGSAWVFMGNSIAAFQASMTTATDPATNAATSTANIDNFGGVVITTTTTANAQTLQSPTDTTSGRQFIAINDDASSDPITINGTAVTIGKMVSFIWDGSAWIGPQDVSTDVTLVGTPNYLTISGQEITMALIATSDIADEAVTNAKLAHIATQTIKGRDTAGTDDVEDLTASEVRSIISVEENADVTDTANVTSAGALMDSELTSIADVKALDQSVVSGAAPVLAATNMTGLPTGNATHTGDVTGDTTLTIATDAVDIAMLSATGTASGTTFLRGDNTWSTPAGGGSQDEALVISIGDETTDMATGTATTTFRMPFAMTLTEVRASVTTAGTTGTTVLDINDGGTSIMTTNKLDILTTATIDDGTATLTDTALADKAIITIDIDAVSTTPAKGCKIYLIGTRT